MARRGANAVPLSRGGQQGGAPRHNRFYALQGRQRVEEAPDIITGMLKVFDFDVYALIDPGATLSFVTPFVAKKFHVEPELLCESYEVSTPIGASIVARRVYKNCSVCILHKILPCDLVELDMVDFDIILGMDWLHAYYASIDCRTRRVKFPFPNKLILEWEMISKGCLYHLMRVKDVESKAIPIKPVPIVNEFVEVFLEDLPGVPLDREIDFGIDVLLDTQPISIPPYRMAP
ncbi:hypothetical protein L3H42_11085, partial [Corynebacterium sp. MC-13]|nr:hypothetical protein [Corynebacterium parakroppenstedtii]